MKASFTLIPLLIQSPLNQQLFSQVYDSLQNDIYSLHLVLVLSISLICQRHFILFTHPLTKQTPAVYSKHSAIYAAFNFV